MHQRGDRDILPWGQTIGRRIGGRRIGKRIHLLRCLRFRCGQRTLLYGA
ncbi:hypothetical protein JKG47_02875 [Acidithiobacillus sp. MC6.1]|nr:hypothetical protein [Acidithiobacillus sp. MC6.1]